MRNYETLLKWLENEYSRQFPLSAGLNENAKKVMIDGGNHTLRLIKPFPPRIKSSHGGQIFDVDGHTITDFWQGHFANILGHNPHVVTTGLASAFSEGWGLQTGFADEVQIDAAELLCRLTNNECVRFTTSGTLATLYAIMLARSFTGRSRVLKIAGGWHGGQPWGLKGVKFKKGVGYDHVEGEGLPPATASPVSSSNRLSAAAGSSRPPVTICRRPANCATATAPFSFLTRSSPASVSAPVMWVPCTASRRTCPPSVR
jgi:glutamate-1-semialdehyde 2,1-aminomutase